MELEEDDPRLSPGGHVLCFSKYQNSSPLHTRSTKRPPHVVDRSSSRAISLKRELQHRCGAPSSEHTEAWKSDILVFTVQGLAQASLARAFGPGWVKGTTLNQHPMPSEVAFPPNIQRRYLLNLKHLLTHIVNECLGTPFLRRRTAALINRLPCICRSY